MTYPKYCIVIALFIAMILFPIVDTQAFDRHRFSFSLGGDWASLTALYYWQAAPYLPEVNKSFRQEFSEKIGYAARISYQVRKSIYLDCLGFYPQKTELGYKTTKAFLDDYAGRINPSVFADSKVTGGGLGLSYHPITRKIHPVLSCAMMLYRVDSDIKKQQFSPDSSSSIVLISKAQNWGYGLLFSYGYNFNLFSHYSLNPLIGFRYSNKISAYNKNNGSDLIACKIKTTSFWTGIYLGYAF